LNTKRSDAPATPPAAETESLQQRLRELETEVAKLREQVGRPQRRRLPETRKAINHKFNIAGHEGYLNVGLFDDGQPGELFITMAKEGSTIGGLMDSIATLTSMSLQYGVPLEALVKKFSHQRFEPSGFTRNPDIRNASSIIDYVFRWMAFQFIRGYREENSAGRSQQELPMPGLQEEIKKRVNKPVPDLPVDEDDTSLLPKPPPPPTHSPAPRPTPGEAQDYSVTASFVNQLDAPMCSNCGHVTVRCGACYKCLNCGESYGCG
jgi:ribonucleoside-diphosphate reductase alpha chain